MLMLPGILLVYWVFHVLLDGAKGSHNYRDCCCFEPPHSLNLDFQIFVLILLSFSVVLTEVLETFSIRFFMGNRKLQFAVRRLQFQVARVLKFSKAFDLFYAAMLFFVKSKCFPFIAEKTWIIHWFEFKNLTSTSQTGTETYFLPLNVRLYNF